MIRALLPLLALLLITAFPAAAAPETPSGAQVLGFADHLFAQGDYYRAITEYERFLYLYPDDPRVRSARYRIARCYFEGDKLPTAIALLRSLTADPVADDVGRDSLHLLGEAYYLRQNYEQSRETYGDFLRHAPEDRRADGVRMRIGWSYLRQGDWRRAAEEFENLPPGSPLRESAEGLAAGARSYPEVPVKSPAIAGWMSAVLPGAGQLYVGRPRDATVSFLLNGTFIWATAEQFRKDNHVTGSILLFFEAGWYVGNIYNAVGSAHKYNRRAGKAYLDGLEERYGVSYSLDRNGTHHLAFMVRF